MSYYRMAMQNRQTGKWIWKTTALTSLQAVLQLLRNSAALPQDRVRVFTASSKEGLNEMLSRENQDQESGSVTAIQFLQARNIQVRVPTQSASEQRLARQDVRQATTTRLSDDECKQTAEEPGKSDMSWLDKRRLELECGVGGDHDSPYTFTLPISTPQILAWIRLMVRVRTGGGTAQSISSVQMSGDVAMVSRGVIDVVA